MRLQSLAATYRSWQISFFDYQSKEHEYMNTTQQQAVDWALQQIGKSLNADGKYGAQCWDFIIYYTRYLGSQAPAVAGAAEWANKQWPAGFSIQRSNPQPGDIGIWDATQSNKWGHAFVVISVSGSTMDVVDQNYINFNPDNGSPAARHSVPINSRLSALIRPAFAPNTAAGSQPGKYTIQKGDTLWGLEQKNGWVNNTLVSLNPGTDPRKLQVGQQIIIPGGNPPAPTPPHEPAKPAPQPQQRTHIVENGENLSVIAARYGISNWRQIYDIPQNKVAIGSNPALIHPGLVLLIP
jgi:LysM repeat protein